MNPPDKENDAGPANPPQDNTASGSKIDPDSQPSSTNPEPSARPIWAAELNSDGTIRTDYRDLDLPDAVQNAEFQAKVPRIPVAGPPCDGEFNTSARMSIGGKPVYVLPSGPVSFIEASEVIFADLGKMNQLFVQGATVVEVVFDRKTGDGKLVRVT